MESANLHHQHQLQDQFVQSSSISTPFYVAGSNNSWNPNLILNDSNLNLNYNRFLSNSTDLRQNNDILAPPLNTSMVQDMGFHWSGNACQFPNQSANELNLSNIKEELSSDSSHKFADQSNSEDYQAHSTSYAKDERPSLHDLNQKLLLETISSGCRLNELQAGAVYSTSRSSASFGGVDTSSRGSYSKIFPSANISNLTPSPFLCSSSMNLQVLDLLKSEKFGGAFTQPAHNNLGQYKESSAFGLDHMQESSNWLTSSPNKIPSLMNGVIDTKRSSSLSEPKVSHTAPKKPRFDSRSSLTPFKVRKEKLGDRIAALQQLVAPFGKTDTASVLMEAIGYIKFLQDQVETLSVPFMKSTRNNTPRLIQEVLREEGDQETKLDLRSRGLCLVPLSCTSYITNDNLGVWPGSDYGGGRT